MDLTNWLATPNVSIDFRENYGAKLLVAPDGRQPEFSLKPKYLKNSYGEETIVQFRLTYASGRMLENWADVLLTPLGTEEVPPLPKRLPQWSPDKAPEYAAALDPLIAALYRTDTPFLRLEAYLPLFVEQSPDSKRALTIDRVRMVYLQNAVNALNPNLVLVVFSFFDGYQIRQNGAGSGPPN